MSSAVRAGLIFGAVGVVVVIATAFIPRPGPVVCGPLLALVVGAMAGYYGVRWSAEHARVSRGVLAGALAGLGTLIGAVIAYTILYTTLVRSDPLVQEQIQEIVRQSGGQADPGTIDLLLTIAGPIAGLCFGVLDLVLALALATVGGWLAARNRPQPAP